ncbi:MAG: 6-phosphofructokinase, partial [Chloroflexi bacterium]|nr:6-phosphofructokinase [Chloroflexota bacterium]
GHIRLELRGLGPTIAEEIQKRVGFETRFVVLGHLQRGGSPTVFDRVLATRMGVYAVDLIKEGKFARMVSLQGDKIVDVPLAEIAHKRREVDQELVDLARIFY